MNVTQRPMKYNPAFLPEEELVRCFVVREADLRLVVDTVRENAGGPNQHMLVIGGRGMGKTTLVLRATAEVRRDPLLREQWYPLVFAEESYEVTTPGEFWLTAIFHLWQQEGDEQWERTYNDLRQEANEKRLLELSLSRLLDFADRVGKRLLLVVENLDMLLGDQISHDDAWVLRHTLQHESRVMLLGSATSHFDEVENAGKAMLESFRTLQLKPLTTEECRTLWESVAGQALPAQQIRPIQILTGGSPRLLTIIGTFAAGRSFRALMDDLTQLVDDHTEYFKSHLDSLPPTERKVYLALAETWDPATARSVAQAARLDVNMTSSLLKRLVARGAVVVNDARQRTKWYQVAERLYNIYYLMRRRGAPSSRVRAVVNFMISFYGEEDLIHIACGIAKEACGLDARSRKDHYLAYEALVEKVNKGLRARVLQQTPAEFLEGMARLHDLRESPLPDDRALLPGITELPTVDETTISGRALREVRLGTKLYNDRSYEEAAMAYRRATDIDPSCFLAWLGLGICLHGDLGRTEEGMLAVRRALEIDPAFAPGWTLLAMVQADYLKQPAEAEDACRHAIDLEPTAPFTWSLLGRIIRDDPTRWTEAVDACQKAVELAPEYASGWFWLGRVLATNPSRHGDAERAYRRAIELEPGNGRNWFWLGELLGFCPERREETEEAYRKAADLGYSESYAWMRLGALLAQQDERQTDAEVALRRAIELDPGSQLAWLGLTVVLAQAPDRLAEAVRACQKSLELDPNLAIGWRLCGMLLALEPEDRVRAEAAYRNALELDLSDADTWRNLGALLANDLKRRADAEAALRKAIELRPPDALAWKMLGALLAPDPERRADAERAFQKATELEPQDSNTWVLLGLLQGPVLDRQEEAEAAYRTSIRLHPENWAAWPNLMKLLLSQEGRRGEGIAIANECYERFSQNAALLNALAWDFYEVRAGLDLGLAEKWIREAVQIEPGRSAFRHTLACILAAQGKGDEALAEAEQYLADAEPVSRDADNAIRLAVQLAVAGVGRQTLEVLERSPSAQYLEPLVVGLKLYLGDEVKAPVEILETGKDVAERIRLACSAELARDGRTQPGA